MKKRVFKPKYNKVQMTGDAVKTKELMDSAKDIAHKTVEGKVQFDASVVKQVIIKKCDGEYRVPSLDGKELGSYYTFDKDDAEMTARHMYGSLITITHRTVKEFP